MVPGVKPKVHVLTHTTALMVWAVLKRASLQHRGRRRYFPHERSNRPLFRSAHIRYENAFSARRNQRRQFAAVRATIWTESYLRPMGFYGSEKVWPARRQPESARNGRGLEAIVHVARSQKSSAIKGAYVLPTSPPCELTMCKGKAIRQYINSMLALQEAVSSECEEARC